MRKSTKRAPTLPRCAACQGSGVGPDDTECVYCFGRGTSDATPSLVLLTQNQAGIPTSILFRDKAYDVQRQNNERIPYYFLDKRTRYVLVKKPAQHAKTTIFMVMSDGTMKVHACYRLTVDGQLIEVV